ncbi:unnamed protein product [Malus baccata var. baccata]
MDDGYIAQGRRHGAQKITNIYHHHVDLFIAFIDKQLVELNSRFDEVNTKKTNSFCSFYPNEFSTCQLLAFQDQLGHYILDIRSSSVFSQLKGIGSLAKK